MIKEIRLTPNIAQHDIAFKLNHAKQFLQSGNQVKISVFFRGRMIVFVDRGKETLLKFIEELDGYGTAQNTPKLVGKRMEITLNPKRK